MKKPILAFLFLACVTARADLVMEVGGNVLRLMASPCTNPAILENLKSEYHSQFKRGQVTVNGKTAPVCWIDTMQGAYYVQMEDGGFALPVSAFVDVPGV